LFLVTLKKKALEWYTQFPANHFVNWNDLKTTFIQRFQSTKSEGKIIKYLSHVKQKKDELVEEFYERVMVAAAKIQPAPGEKIRKTWFINGLRKEYEKYVNILPSDTLEEALASARKIEMSKMKKERMREDESSGDSNSDSNGDARRRKKKGKAKKADITKDDLKALKQEIEELAIGTRNFRTGVTCRRCRNEGHYSNECQLKSCSNCNSTTHNTNECVYDGRRREKRYGVNQVQPQLNNNRRRAEAIPPRFRDEERPRFGENRPDMRYPYQGRDKQGDEGYPYNGQDYRRGDWYPYDNYQRKATYPYRSQYYPREEAYPYQGGPRGPINHGRLEYPREVMDNMSQKVAPRIGYTGLPRREGNADECYYCHQQGHRKPECSLLRKHQEEANDYAKKPRVAANVVTPSVCNDESPKSGGEREL
jgi:hypothetical protein